MCVGGGGVVGWCSGWRQAGYQRLGYRMTATPAAMSDGTSGRAGKNRPEVCSTEHITTVEVCNPYSWTTSLPQTPSS